MKDKQHPNKAFRWLIISIGAPAFLWCVNHLPVVRLDLRFLLLALTVVITARIAVQIPSISYHITVSDTLIFLTLLLYGGNAAVLVATLDGICSAMRISKKPTTILFNASVMALSTFVTAGAVMLWFGPVLGIPPQSFSNTFIALISVMALVQYLTNSGLIALDRALQTGQSIWQTWRRHYLWTSITYFAGASAASITARLMTDLGFYPIVLTAPIIAIVYFTYRTYLKSVAVSEAQARQAVSHVEEQERYISELELIRKELQESREHFRNAALHDGLTGLPNRALLLDRLRLVVAQAKRHPDHLFAVLFLDLDRFKMINDSLGHVAGDELLIATSRRLANSLRTSDTVARLGGDEFAILLDELESNNDVIRVAERLQEDLIQPYHIGGQEVFTTASIGIALRTTGYESAENILRDADTAMYRAKQNGKARYELFDKEMHAEAVAMLRLESDLRRALERDELVVYYQPIVSLKDEKISGFEALVRWQHPQRGLIPPADFIPIAEDTGLIIDIGRNVLREACRQMREWQCQGLVDSSVTMSVNLSSKQFTSPKLEEQVARILEQTDLDPNCLNLEVTETVVTENAESACITLRQLRALGIHLSIDDFGTGYSSLSYLHRFPVNTLKIDRSFISNMAAGSENSSIVRTIIALAHNLGMTVVAEGIETEAQREELSASGCEHAQGYLFARPAAASTIEELMRKQQISNLSCIASKETASLALAIRAGQLPEFAQCST
jgi:diguanylate cyclase (GGDEF)-like protein